MSVIISHLSRLISIQDQVEEIIAAADGHKDPYLNTLDMTNSENLKLYNKAIFGLPDNYRYDLIGPSRHILLRIIACCIHVWIKNSSTDVHIQRCSTRIYLIQ